MGGEISGLKGLFMSKILDLAKDFERKSKQQASDTEQSLKSEFERHERSISEALRSSEQKIKDDISAQNAIFRRLVLKSWLWVTVSVILVLSASWGVIFYQGTLIAENWQKISEQKDVLKQIEAKTWGLELVDGDKGRFIVIPKGYTGKTGWSVGKNELIKLEKK